MRCSSLYLCAAELLARGSRVRCWGGWTATFYKYDKNQSGSLSATDLTQASLDLFSVHLSHSHAEALLKQADLSKTGELSLDEFTFVAKKFLTSIPDLVKKNSDNSAYRFISFGTNERLGIELYDTEEEDGVGNGVLVVKAVKGVAQEAGVPIGAVITFMHNEKLPLGFSQDELTKKAREQLWLARREGSFCLVT